MAGWLDGRGVGRKLMEPIKEALRDSRNRGEPKRSWEDLDPWEMDTETWEMKEYAQRTMFFDSFPEEQR